MIMGLFGAMKIKREDISELAGSLSDLADQALLYIAEKAKRVHLDRIQGCIKHCMHERSIGKYGHKTTEHCCKCGWEHEKKDENS